MAAELDHNNKRTLPSPCPINRSSRALFFAERNLAADGQVDEPTATLNG